MEKWQQLGQDFWAKYTPEVLEVAKVSVFWLAVELVW
jgi:hypothetical protein